MIHETDYEEQTFDIGVRGICSCGFLGGWHHEAGGEERFDRADCDLDAHLAAVGA